MSENEDAVVGDVVVALPAGLEMSAADQERLRARQAAEMQRSEGQRTHMMEGFRTMHDMWHLMGLMTTCGLTWSVLMYLRIVKHSDLSWPQVMLPQIVSYAFGTAFMLRQGWQRRHVDARLRRTQHGPVQPAVLSVENLGKIGTLWMIAGHLERDAPATVQEALYPTILSEVLSFLISAALFRPLEENDVEIGGQRMAREETVMPASKVVKQRLGPKVITLCAYLSIASRCDGDSGTWVSALWGVWLVLAGLGLGVIVSFLMVCGAGELPPEIRLVGATAICCCFAPLVVLALVFFIFLAEDLDGTRHHSDATIVGLMVALQVFGSALTFVLFYSMDRTVQQQEAEARVMADLAEHNDAEAGGAGGADARAAEIDARVREQQKRLKLVRESSTLFRRLASSGVGFDLEQPPSSPPALERAASSRDAMECAICYENARDAFVQPCGHGGFCYTCGKTLLATRAKCPLCRTPIEEVLLIDASATRRDEQGRVVVETEKSAMTREVEMS